MIKNLFYNREKKIGMEFDSITQNFILMALSAKDKEMMIAEAQRNHANTVKLLAEAEDSLRTIYLLQNIKRLAEVMLAAECKKIVAKAALTLAEDEIDFREKMETKVESMTDARRVELLKAIRENWLIN